MKPNTHKEQLVIPVYYYEDENGQITYDLEQMREEFENELSKLNQSNYTS